MNLRATEYHPAGPALFQIEGVTYGATKYTINKHRLSVVIELFKSIHVVSLLAPMTDIPPVTKSSIYKTAVDQDQMNADVAKPRVTDSAGREKEKMHMQSMA
jgi:hypothetical protein